VTFAVAGASHVALLGRTKDSLLETAESVKSRSKASCSVHIADITRLESLEAAAAAIGKWHVLVLSSGYCSTTATVSASGGADWWKGFEVSNGPNSPVNNGQEVKILTLYPTQTNVQGTFSVARAFLPSADSAQATFIGITTDVSLVPAAYLPVFRHTQHQNSPKLKSSSLSRLNILTYLSPL
jgi:NAD(P)-dependent dehydrogenase (short-subunit alcohol dehydrogenase family)